MRRMLLIAAALAFAWPVAALAAPPDKNNTPMTRPAVGARPVGKPGNGHHRPPYHRPPHHRPPGTKPPAHRPPHHRPPVWHRPTANKWWWRNRWIGRVRAPVFVYPRGYAYRHWAAGQRLPALFLTAAYFYDAFAALGLDPPPPGYRWVRYGPDLLLVNLSTGEVEDVAYGVFY